MSCPRFAVALALLVALGTCPAHGVTWRVPADFPTIEDAVDLAEPHDSILVAPGEYQPARAMRLDRPSVTLKSEVRRQAVITNVDHPFDEGLFSFESDSCVVEGFQIYATSWVVFDGIPDCGGPPTIDDNRIEDNFVFGLSWTSGIVFEYGQRTKILRNEITSFIDGIWAGSHDALVQGNLIYQGVGAGIGVPISGVVRGNTIRGVHGYEDYGAPLYSGGINVFSAEGAVLVEENVIEENRSDRGDSDLDGLGGGILIWNSGDVTVRNNRIARNQARRGAGIYAGRSYVRIEGNLIWANHDTTDWEGEGRHGRGGGLYIHRCDGWIVGNTVVGNRATMEGAAAYFDTTSAMDVRNNIFAANASTGTGIYVAGPFAPEPYACNDAWQNGRQNYGGWTDPTGLEGNISLDPVFCRPDTGSFTLRDDSPCAPPNSPQGCGLIGAFEVSCGVNGIADPSSMRLGPRIVAFPNPANRGTWICWSRSRDLPRPVQIQVIEVGGRIVRSITPNPGEARAFWDGRLEGGAPAPSGVYFVRAEIDGVPLTRSITVFK